MLIPVARFVLFVTLTLAASPLFAQTRIVVDPSQTDAVIAPEIYGHFAEHLGRCVYGGLWVGANSEIPNVRGYRKDVLEALQKLDVPVMRWPGGCFADDYHWRDGIGPKGKRPRTTNIYWGGIDDNSFGTHEFLNLCELLDCEAYIAGNVGSGTVEEMREWVEYMTSDSQSTLAQMRRENGRDKPWRVKFFGVGNENWGCGGNMTAEYYSNLYRRYQTYVRNFSGNRITKIANGPSGRDVPFMKTLVTATHKHADAFSMHYYVLPTSDWSKKGASIGFAEAEWFSVVKQSYEVEDLIKDYIAILDSVDPEKRLGLYVDEWGTWYDKADPGDTALYQQNTIRDAVSAALFLNVFHRHADRITMGNIAQVVNVLQAMILTKEDRMLVTPTYHVFEMYKVHQGGKHIPLKFTSPSYACETADSGKGSSNGVNAISATASTAEDGAMYISLSNADPKVSHSIELSIPSWANLTEATVTGRTLSGDSMDAHNTFDKPDTVQPKPAKFETSETAISVELPPGSVTTIQIRK